MISSWNKAHPNALGRSVSTTVLGVRETLGGAAVAKWAWAELDVTPGALNQHRSNLGQNSADAGNRDEVEAAYRRGVADGKEALQETVCRELELANSAALSAVETVRRSSETWAARLEENLVALAVGIARQIVEREIVQDPELFVELARTAVAAFPVDQPVRVRLHPDDLALLVAGGGSANASTISVGDRTVPWISDPEMGRGGCLVEGPFKIVDGRLDTVLQRVYRKLTDG